MMDFCINIDETLEMNMGYSVLGKVKIRVKKV
jgi:hypothetical protein